MAAAPFDPNGAVRFDLKNGAASDSRGARLVLVPSEALAALGGDALAELGAAIGRACGGRVAARLGGDGGVRAAPLELVVTHLAGELAIAGIGAVHVERWGRAMIVVVANASVDDDALLGGVLAGALSVSAGRDVSAAAVGRDGASARYFLGKKATAERAESLAASGRGFAEIIATLQGASS